MLDPRNSTDHTPCFLSQPGSKSDAAKSLAGSAATNPWDDTLYYKTLTNDDDLLGNLHCFPGRTFDRFTWDSLSNGIGNDSQRPTQRETDIS